MELASDLIIRSFNVETLLKVLYIVGLETASIAELMSF